MNLNSAFSWPLSRSEAANCVAVAPELDSAMQPLDDEASSRLELTF